MREVLAMKREGFVTSNVRIRLIDPYTQWYVASPYGETALRVYARGYAQIDGREIFDQELANEIWTRVNGMHGRDPLGAAVELIPRLSGGWCCVVAWPDGRVLAAVDRLRSIPLFWAVDGNSLTLADDPIRCVDHSDELQVDDVSVLEYLLAGYVPNGRTLYKGIQQLRAGEMLEWNQSEPAVKRVFYYRFSPRITNCQSQDALEDEFESLVTRWFSIFAQSLTTQRVVVPLSGGLDSRFVAAMLRRSGVENVLCVSYGTHEDQEVSIGRDVAVSLGYEWRYIELGRKEWEATYTSSRSHDYWLYCSKWASMPHWQDFPAVCKLANEGYRDESTIYFPGHTGDMLSGGHLPRFYRYLERGAISPESAIFGRHFKLWPLTKLASWSELTSLVQQNIRLTLSESGCDAASGPWQTDSWNIMCRQALYIVNSVRAYEFVNARWRTMWNYDLMDFFAKLSLDDRFGRRFYLTVLRNRIFSGPLTQLSQIPLAHTGKWDTKAALADPMNRIEFQLRQLAGVSRTAKRLLRNVMDWSQRRKRKGESVLDCLTQLQFVNATLDTRLQEVLKAFGDVSLLPRDAKCVIEPYMKHKVCTLPWLGVFSAATLCFLLSTKAQPTGDTCIGSIECF